MKPCVICRLTVGQPVVSLGRLHTRLCRLWLRLTVRVDATTYGMDWEGWYSYHCGRQRSAGIFPTRERAMEVAKIKALQLLGYRVPLRQLTPPDGPDGWNVQEA